jgi:uncharacterized protein YacL
MNSITNAIGYNPIEYIPAVFVTGKIGVFIGLIFAFLYSYGAAKLSYTYNMANNGSMIYLWCILCFFFATIYYPYYAFFLNPVLPMAVVGVRVGGRR